MSTCVGCAGQTVTGVSPPCDRLCYGSPIYCSGSASKERNSSPQNETATTTLPHRRRSERSEPYGPRCQTRHDTARGQQTVETAGRGIGLPDLHPPWPLVYQIDATRGTYRRAC